MWIQWRQRIGSLPWSHLGPLSAGILFACYWAWRHGRSFVFEQTMWGYGWPGYVLEAWLVEHGELQRIDDLRTPLYPGLLGALGESMGSYADAGVFLSSISVIICAIFVGIGATAMANGWAGGLAASCATVALTHQEAPTTINQYPMLTAACSAALGLALLCARWPRARWAGLTGLATGFAWMVESRGLLVLPLILFLVGIGTWHRRASKPWSVLTAFLLPFLLCGLARMAMVDAQRLPHERNAEYETLLVDRQRDVVHRWIGLEDDLRNTPCDTIGRDQVLRLSFLTSSCASLVLHHNINERLPRHLPLGIGLSLLLGLGALFPGKRGRWGTVESLGVLSLGGGGILLLASLTPLPRRYLLQATPIIAVLCAVGATRIAITLGRRFDPRSRWAEGLSAALCTSSLIWMWSGGSGGRALPETAQLGEHYHRYNALTELVRDALAPGDGLLDCGEQHVELALLPHRTHEETPSKQADADACSRWIEAPSTATGSAWILVSDDPGLHWRHDRSPLVPLPELLESTSGWERFDEGERWELWRWEN